MLMALDEACMEAVRDGAAPPTVRLYRWEPSAITIGNFQCLADEIDAHAVAAAGVPVVRRQTGGGAVYHDQEGEVTYSIIAPLALFPPGVPESSAAICSVLVNALADLGLHAEFRPINDIIVDGRKVSGNAQTRRSGVLLQHGTILLTVDAATMFRFLTPDKSKLSDKPFIKSVNAAVTSLAEHGVTNRSAIEHTLREAFRRRFPGTDGTWTTRELYRAEELARTKYGSDEWNRMR
jgi:lipoate-protein ligase A